MLSRCLKRELYSRMAHRFRKALGESLLKEWRWATRMETMIQLENLLLNGTKSVFLRAWLNISSLGRNDSCNCKYSLVLHMPTLTHMWRIEPWASGFIDANLLKFGVKLRAVVKFREVACVVKPSKIPRCNHWDNSGNAISVLSSSFVSLHCSISELEYSLCQKKFNSVCVELPSSTNRSSNSRSRLFHIAVIVTYGDT